MQTVKYAADPGTNYMKKMIRSPALLKEQPGHGRQGNLDFEGQRLKAEFRKEVTVLQALDHPNICKFLGIVDTPENQFIVAEFVPFSLFDIVHRRKYEFNLSDCMPFGFGGAKVAGKRLGFSGRCFCGRLHV